MRAGVVQGSLNLEDPAKGVGFKGLGFGFLGGGKIQTVIPT